jgi:hypothetical protein
MANQYINETTVADDAAATDYEQELKDTWNFDNKRSWFRYMQTK